MSAVYAAVRILAGLVFVVSGYGKLVRPYQNFLLIVESYQLIEGPMAVLTARVLPWAELFCGVFLIFGLWTRFAVRAAWVMYTMFLVVLAQALLRGLNLDECGCLGDLLMLSPGIMLMFDASVWLALLGLWHGPGRAERWSLDGLLEKQTEVSL